jgi:hypothetical protein
MSMPRSSRRAETVSPDSLASAVPRRSAHGAGWRARRHLRASAAGSTAATARVSVAAPAGERGSSGKRTRQQVRERAEPAPSGRAPCRGGAHMVAAGERGSTCGWHCGSSKRMRQRAHGASGRARCRGRAHAVPAVEHGRPIETCGSRASSATLALPRRLEAAPDGKWTCGEQIDKFRGLFSAFASSWTGVAQTDKLKGRQCISLFF